MKKFLFASASGLAIAASIAMPAASQLLPASRPAPSVKVQPKGGANLPAPAGGIAEMKETSFDVGRIAKGGAIEHEFTIKNTGTGALSIHAKPG
jgi:hypothetical protein